METNTAETAQTAQTRTSSHFKKGRSISFGRSVHKCKNIEELRLYKRKLLDELNNLYKQEANVARFELFKQSILKQLLHTYIEFLTYLLRLLDVRQSYHQQKFVYWTNLKHFACDSDMIHANLGCDIPREQEESLDKLFSEIQQLIQSIPVEDIKSIQSQLDRSILYQMFIRSNSAYRSILTRSSCTTYGNLLLLQKQLASDMRREKTVDPIQKRFYDEWLIPQIREHAGGAEKPRVTKGGGGEWDQISSALRQLAKKVFQVFSTDKELRNADQLERITWLITRQWNFLFVECELRLKNDSAQAWSPTSDIRLRRNENGSTAVAATRDDRQEDDKNNNGKNDENTSGNDTGAR